MIVDARFNDTPSTTAAFDYHDYNGLERRNAKDSEVVAKISNLFNFKIENAPIIWYPRGTSNVKHCDNSIIENGKVIRVTNWNRSAIVFLNDEFNGGELVYPEQGLVIKPKTGTMVVAPAGYQFPHFVTSVDSDRYVLVLRII
jgi:hypothetical protein